nr:zf-CCHC domain-containing protein/DUF4219 domain-containing protein/UBN2 domain-containing protein [Tanacetum cinerariifolium]
MMKETPYELLKDDQKKQLGKNNEANMTLYNALPRKEYERVFMCKTAKEVWHTLIITRQGNSQVKDYQDYSSKNHVRVIDSDVVTVLAMVPIDSKEVVDIILETKEVKAQDKGEVATIATKKVTLLVSVQSPKKTRPFLEELGVIVKTMMNLKMMQHVSWQSTLKWNKRLFTSYKAYDGGHVVFGNNLKGKVIGGENIEQFLNNFANQPNETDMNNLDSDDKSVDTPLVSPFPHSDNDSNDDEVLNELIEYENVGMLPRERAINSFDGDDLHSNV